MHLVVEGVTVVRQRLNDNEEPANYSLERVLIFRLYSGKNVLNNIQSAGLLNGVIQTHLCSLREFIFILLRVISCCPYCQKGTWITSKHRVTIRMIRDGAPESMSRQR